MTLFLRLVCVFIRIFKQSQFVFQFQERMQDSSIRSRKSCPSYKAHRFAAVNTGHHINVNACLGGADSRLLTVCAVAVVNNLLIAAQSEIRTPSNPISSRRMPRISFLVSGCRNTVYRVEGSHYHRHARIDTGFVGWQIEVTEGMLGKLYRIVVSSCCCRSTIACEMLHTGSNLVRLLQIVS